MKESWYQQRNIDGKPIKEIIFSQEKLFCSSRFLNKYKIDIIAKIDQHKIGNNNWNNTDNRSFGCSFRPWDFFIQKTVQHSVSSSQYKRINKRDKQGI